MSVTVSPPTGKSDGARSPNPSVSPGMSFHIEWLNEAYGKVERVPVDRGHAADPVARIRPETR